MYHTFMKTPKALKIAIFAGLFLFLPLLPAQAFSTKAGESVFLTADEKIDGSYYLAASNISLEGEVLGDVICAGQNINIKAKVLGDVICAGQSINISGEVLGNVRLVASNINLSGTVGKNVNAFSSSFIMAPEAKIGWDLMLFSPLAEVRGQINGYFYGQAEKLVFAGSVGKNMEIKMDKYTNDKIKGKIEILGEAKVGGDLLYTSLAEVSTSSAEIKGKVIHQIPKAKERGRAWSIVWGRLLALLSAVLIGFIVMKWFSQEIKTLSQRGRKKIGLTFALGLIPLFATPVAVLLLGLSIIGLPLGLIVLLLWLILLYLAKILGAIFLGYWLLPLIRKKESPRLYLEMIFGLALVLGLKVVPVFGPLLSLAACLFGFGLIVLYFKKDKVNLSA